MTFVHGFANVTLYSHVETTSLHLSLGSMVILFFILSACFQLAFASSQSRYIEYAFSGSLVIVVVLLQVGIYDAHTIFAMAVLGITMNLCGYIADLAFFGENLFNTQNHHRYKPAPQKDPLLPPSQTTRLDTIIEMSATAIQNTNKHDPDLCKIAYVSHAVGWIAFTPIITSIVAAYVTATKVPGNHPPNFVKFIVAFEVVFLTAFGVAQLVSFSKKARENPTYIHVIFISLSIVAKMFLGWILAAELFL
jgi:hypothetical protein